MKAWFGKEIEEMKKIHTFKSFGKFYFKREQRNDMTPEDRCVGVEEEYHKIVHATKQEKFNVK